MKLKDIVSESNVSYSLDQRRMSKQAQAGKEKRMAQDQEKADRFVMVDKAIAATLDFLVNEQGMSEEDAEAAMADHLGDLTAAYDLSKGM